MRIEATAALGALLVGVVTGCGGATGSPAAESKPASPTPTAQAGASASPSSSPGLQAQAALTAYEAAWSDAAAVEDGGNYQDPRLERHMGGQLLMAVSENFYIEETHGVASRGAPVLHPHVSSENLGSNPPTVTITDCIDFSHFIQYYASTGQQYGPLQTGLSADSTTMTLVNGAWMATDDNVQPDGSCSL